ncbi:Serine/threonine protein kinase PpkA [Lysobacter dokdonensis DS-58]|uniref:Serine/threonine protein kinase PpkA n=1 Tax=Lysobacter dokdonensis DS-58 TaxID=1300345 RepID=A0A0A2X689_9GAMM|nr:bifunctional serine/threonine-protein kinase/formylglycine-generating enzyme family protein [Lysobacter dokdonensis]KGQ20729.1 Serine/threonine protein kinase PpkA [Lysobacter dokdonensis DS-58]
MSVDPSSHHDAASALPRIAGFRLLREIGQGGMSTVYLAEQESLGRKVALKVMLPEALTDEVSRRRFENEARTIARLDHPNIVGIYEVGRTADDLPFYAMPYLGRGHLGVRISRQDGRTRDQQRVIATLRALLEALDYAHVRGVVHRDVKAENVLFDDAERPQLADFGIALRKGINPRLTMTGLAVGSTAYMPPEQARGEEVDSRADLYSIGVLAWEMLTGMLPFNAADALSMAVMHAKDPIPRLPAELMHWQRFIDKSLAKSPANRFRSAQQMLEALDRIERGGFSFGAMVANFAQLWRRTRVLPKPLLIGGGLLCAAMIGVASQHDADTSDFFRVETLPELRKPIQPEVVDRMMQPPPESPAQQLVTNAEAQLAARKLTAPQGDNAYDSVLAAWDSDPAHAGLPPLVVGVLGSLGDEMAMRLRRGDEDKARDYLQRATQFADRTAPLGTDALHGIHEKAAEALRKRVEASEKSRDRKDALAAAALANEFAGDQALGDTLRARAEKIKVAEADAPEVAIAAGTGNTTQSQPALRTLTRAEYGRFVAATGRESSLCRERMSLLRIVKPRDWREPGFVQSDTQPVVCVSYEDVVAYTHWASRNGNKVRLPSSAELGANPAQTGGRAYATWLKDGSIAGTGWRGPKPRTIERARGYDDVAVKLVHD